MLLTYEIIFLFPHSVLIQYKRVSFLFLLLLACLFFFFFSSSASKARSQLLAQPHVRFFTPGIVLPFHCFTFPHSSSFWESDYGLVKL